MTDYTGLVKTLRHCGLKGTCAGCPREKDADAFCSTEICSEAADAIEELQKQLREEKVDNVNLTGWLAEEHANQCPHYIRNVHDRGDDSLCEKYRCEVKALQTSRQREEDND